MLWKITRFPPCRCHVFLSHSSEDKASLVEPLCERLKSKGVIPWVDVHDYPWCRASYEALRWEILESRHIAYLKQYAAEMVRGVLHDKGLLGMVQQREGMLHRIDAAFLS